MCAHPVSEGGREEERLERKGGGEGGRRKGGKMEGEKKWEGNVEKHCVHAACSSVQFSPFSSSPGLDEVGIFRLPGQTSRIQTLKEHYDQGMDVSLLMSQGM